MKRFRLLLSFAVLLLLVPMTTTKAATFPDVKQYAQEIDYLVGEQIIKGYANGTFQPSRHINRLNGVQILLKAKGITHFDAPNPNFTDLQPGMYGYEEVAKAVELGIISGKTSTNGSKYFDASAPLTRGQMAKILVETMDLPIDRSFTFRDVPVDNGYYPYVSTLAVQRITEGYPDRRFRPNEPISRQHFSVFVARLLNDDFKPTVNKTSYASNRGLVYTFKLENGSYVDKRFLRTEQIGRTLMELWNYKNSKTGAQILYEWENQNGLYWTDVLESEYVTDLDYPLYPGKEFPHYYGGESEEWVSGMDLTVKTPAGTFYQVTAIETVDGYTTYYAPGYGSIKSVRYGRTISELVDLKIR